MKVQPGETLAHFKSSHVETGYHINVESSTERSVPSSDKAALQEGQELTSSLCHTCPPTLTTLNPLRMAATGAQVLLRKPGYNQTGVSWGSCRSNDHYYLQLTFTES